MHIYSLVLALLLPCYMLHSQEKNFSEEGSYVITRNLSLNDSVYNNYIVRDLAYGKKVPISSVGIILDYQVNLTFREDLRVLGVFVSPLMARDHTYKGFDISGDLLPSSFSMNVTLTGPAGEPLQHLKVFVSDRSRVLEVSLPDMLPGPVEDITVTDLRWYYTESDYNDFIAAVLQINNYYAAVDLMEDMEAVMEAEKPTESADIVSDFVHRMEWQRVLIYIDDYYFIKQLNLSEYDPRQFISLRDRLGRLNTRHQTLFIQKAVQSQNAGSFSPSRAAAIYVDAINSYYDRKLTSDHQYALFYDRLIRSSLTSIQLEKERMLMHQVNGGEELFIRFMQELYRDFISHGKKLIRENDHEKALTWFFKALDLGTKMPGEIIADPDLDELIDTARKGLHDSYFYLVRRSLDKGNVGMARSYLDEAVRVSSALWNQVSFTTLFTLRRDIIAGYLDACDTLWSDDPGKALGMIRELRSFCRQYNVQCPEAVDRYEEKALSLITKKKLEEASKLIVEEKIAEADLLLSSVHADSKEDRAVLADLRFRLAKLSFVRFLSMAGRYQELGKDQLALRYYILSDFLREKYPGLDGDLARDGIRATAAPLLIADLEEVQQTIRALGFEEAESTIEEIRERQHEYYLVTDSLINALVVEAELLLNAYRCEYESMRFEKGTDSIKTFLEQAEYLSVLSAADRVMSSPYIDQCGLGSEEVALLKRKAELALEYLAKEERLRDLETGSADFISEYADLNRFYRENNLYELGLELTSMEKYICESEEPDCFRMVIDFYVGHQLYDEAFAVLTKARDQGHPSKTYRDLQEKLGGSLARTIFGDDKDANPYVIINNRTKNDPWFSGFRESYLSEWSELSGDE